ncbi:MAG: deoxynucleoside kinase [Candidatus Marinimicrobia bacterium]|nr:deoxynucleoside kinase [Candidatus Neomarinimicrobiota bacterium]MBL7060043.1 deoxynucleoside kinase [Candidatus Neomarinimicrobiota bacterium]
MKSSPFVGIAGNIGVGKTTFTQIVGERLDWTPYFESVIDNPYLDDFYHDMDRWSFNLQIYFLHHRFKTHVAMINSSKGTIQDRTIYEDVEIFAQNLFDIGKMSKRDWENYIGLFSIMSSFLKTPDLIIYLKASTDTLITRINKRERDFESGIDPGYLHQLNILYGKWIPAIKNIPVYTIDTNNFNIFEDHQMLDQIIENIQSYL